MDSPPYEAAAQLLTHQPPSAGTDAGIRVGAMTPERWKQIDELAQSVLELGSDERAAFLNEACAGDDALRSEVESQIAYQQQASKFLEVPAFKRAAELITDPQAETESMEGRAYRSLQHPAQNRRGRDG